MRPEEKPGRPDGEVALVCRAGWAGLVGTPSTPNLEPSPHNPGRAWKLPHPSFLIAEAFGQPSRDNHTEKLPLYTCLLFCRRLSDGVSQRDAIDFRALGIDFQPARPRPRSAYLQPQKEVSASCFGCAQSHVSSTRSNSESVALEMLRLAVCRPICFYVCHNVL